MTGQPEPYSKILSKKTGGQTGKKERKEERGGGEEGKRKSRVRKKEENYVGSVDDLFRLLSQECRYADTEKMIIGSVDVNS